MIPSSALTSDEGDGFPRTGRVAAIDYGTVRIGIAICDPNRILASPLTVIPAKDWRDNPRDFQSLVDDEQISAFVVGLPIHSDGGESDKSREAREFAKWLSDVTKLPVRMFDERFTTVDAKRRLSGSGFSGKKKKKQIDAIAALVLLESFLEACRYLDAIAGVAVGAEPRGGESLD